MNIHNFTDKEFAKKLSGFICSEESIENISDYRGISEQFVEYAYQMGRQEKEAEWSMPESFELPTQYAIILQEAISQIAREYMITYNTIEIKEVSKNYSQIIVKPTKIIPLFNAFSRYGKLCERATPTLAKRIVKADPDAVAQVVIALSQKGLYFINQPLPDNHWELSVKIEHEDILVKMIGLFTKSWKIEIVTA